VTAFRFGGTLGAAHSSAVGARQHVASASTARMVGYAPGNGWMDGDGLKAWLPSDDSRSREMLAARRKSMCKKKSK
jgi:hypothetical protein